MAITKTDILVPARTEARLTELRCDICGKRAPDPWQPWATGSYNVNAVTVEHRTGTSYPEAGAGEKVIFDICPTCFTGIVMPWLKTQGAMPRTETWDW